MFIQEIPSGIVRDRIIFFLRRIADYELRASRFDSLDSHANTTYGNPCIIDYPDLPVSARMFFEIEMICTATPEIRHGVEFLHEGPVQEKSSSDYEDSLPNMIIKDEEITDAFLDSLTLRRDQSREPFFRNPRQFPVLSSASYHRVQRSLKDLYEYIGANYRGETNYYRVNVPDDFLYEEERYINEFDFGYENNS